MPSVSNTSPISNLACIGRLNLLRDQFSEVHVPSAVETELQNIPDRHIRDVVEEAKRTGWLKPRPATNTKLISLLMMELHQGEAEAIALALEMKAGHLLIDEKRRSSNGASIGYPGDWPFRCSSPRQENQTNQGDQT